jgi:hypothetical protein
LLLSTVHRDESGSKEMLDAELAELIINVFPAGINLVAINVICHSFVFSVLLPFNALSVK